MPRWLKSFLMVVVGIIVVSVGVTLLVDNVCVNTLTPRLPLYPNAAITYETDGFLRRFGMGQTIIILETDDSPDVVRNWYGRAVAAAIEASRGGNQFGNQISRAGWSVDRAQDGSGSQIILSASCATGR